MYKFIILTVIALPLFSKPNRSRDYIRDDRSALINNYRNQSSFLRSSSKSGLSEVSNSDLGAQRPVEDDSFGFGYYFGFDTKINYSSNPIALPDDNEFRQAAGIWENRLRNSFRLGVFDLGGASFSPLLGINLSSSTYFGDEYYDTADFDDQSLNLSFSGIFQFTNGFSIRPTLSYNAQFKKGDILYHETAPSLSIGKNFSFSSVILFSDVALGYFMTDSHPPHPSLPKDELNRIEASFVTGLYIPIGAFEVNPLIGLTYSDYTNVSRKDISINLSLELKYNITDWFFLSLHSSYTSRNSDDSNKDFSRYNLGSSASLNAKF
jgi:hypothetical protein